MEDFVVPDPRVDYLESSFREKMLEHVFVAELLQEAWFRYGRTIEVLRSEVDSSGYDLVLEFNGVIRHVQLKGSREGAATARMPINTALAAKPSGCVVWMIYSRQPGEYRARLSYRFFGGRPGDQLPSLGDRVAKHTKANAQGVKLPRPEMRVVGKASFGPNLDLPALMDALFGPVTTTTAGPRGAEQSEEGAVEK